MILPAHLTVLEVYRPFRDGALHLVTFPAEGLEVLSEHEPEGLRSVHWAVVLCNEGWICGAPQHLDCLELAL